MNISREKLWNFELSLKNFVEKSGTFLNLRSQKFARKTQTFWDGFKKFIRKLRNFQLFSEVKNLVEKNSGISRIISEDF